ncbi:ribosomal protein S18-alanine N-acetyltransferase [Evansella sp. LMS18]|jgi:ribosomal-protein-alanine N-acetyltransferase|uniref:ribosomal protein S18-alanine N-acetyltransferase n=1 Tax=Evansella sp. LMS18 TaxID=2924033 RepID=UPI0020D1A43D|nr:ribosomal protein S18-alanine N-acetyltransferase [Evansella sp. LMS18]UTR08742.1 ribosomal protein S18-alanine N-acetyltransferase [Evansella sp. LMS18]
MGEEVEIRFMDLEDLDQVMEVEHNCFPSPWSRGAFVNELGSNQFAYYLVALSGERIIGYIGVWIIIDEAHITNVAVHSDFRKQGVGEKLLQSSMALAKTLGAKKITLEVRVSNEPAKIMYSKFGFENGGIRKNYYTDNQEDAQIMWVVLE